MTTQLFEFHQESNSLFLQNDSLRLTLSLQEDLFAPSAIEGADGRIWANQHRFFLDLRDQNRCILQANSLKYRKHSTRTTSNGVELTVETEAVFPLGFEEDLVLVTVRYVLDAVNPVLTEQWELTVVSRHSLYLHHAQAIWSREGQPKLLAFAVPFGESGGSGAPLLLGDTPFEGTIRRDGAVLHDAENHCSLVIAKTPTDRDPEYVVVKSDSQNVFFSGFQPNLAYNDCASWLKDGHHCSSPTRFQIVNGTVESALTTYRTFMESQGIGLPQDYAPPFNYCIYYECGDKWSYEKVEPLLSLAAGLGCTLLYTDQGWETHFGSGLWDEVRLGLCADFVQRAKRLGLDTGVLVSLHASSQGDWDPDVFRRTSTGTIEDGDQWHPFGICAGSERWQTDKTARLAKLVADGVNFFSFDFNDSKGYSGPNFRQYPCFANHHNHGLPMTEWEHICAVAYQQQKFHQSCPDVLIESYDWALAGDSTLPICLFPQSGQERWGFEYMWRPFADFQAKRLHNLYFYNLAYSRPLYLHMDLFHDHPEYSTAFWYLASTIRHLGVGNFTALTIEQQKRVRSNTSLYVKYRRYFTQGIFSGKGPCVHIHTLLTGGAVVLFFNDTSEPCTLEADFAFAELALWSDGAIPHYESCLEPVVEVTVLSENIRLSCSLPGWGVGMIHLNVCP